MGSVSETDLANVIDNALEQKVFGIGDTLSDDTAAVIGGVNVQDTVLVGSSGSGSTSDATPQQTGHTCCPDCAYDAVQHEDR